jgi:hypothetical protein
MKASFFYRGFIFVVFAIYIVFFVLAVISTNDSYLDNILKALATPISFTIFIAFFAVAFALENYLRKTDLNISGKVEFYNYKPKKSGYSYDTGVASFQLNNYKDKTVVIYRVYLLLKRGVYIQLLETSKNPILLKAYDTHFEKFKMPLYYTMNNESKVIRDLDISKAKLYLDTNEGKYKVKKGAKHWIPDVTYTLVPKNTDHDYDLNIKFYFADKLQLSLNNSYTSIAFGQDYVLVRGKKIYVGDIETVEDLKGLLQKESPTISGYDVWQPISRLQANHPDWLNAKVLDFNNSFSIMKNEFVEAITKKFKRKGE